MLCLCLSFNKQDIDLRQARRSELTPHNALLMLLLSAHDGSRQAKNSRQPLLLMTASLHPSSAHECSNYLADVSPVVTAFIPKLARNCLQILHMTAQVILFMFLMC